MDPVDSTNSFDVDCKTYTASSFNSEIGPDCFTILHQNVRSFNKNFDLLGFLWTRYQFVYQLLFCPRRGFHVIVYLICKITMAIIHRGVRGGGRSFHIC